MRIADVLRSKGSDVATVDPSVTVAELISQLATHNVGALPVVDEGQLVGIVSERDVVRRLDVAGPGLLEASVGDIMITGVTTCAPGDSVADIAAVMTNRRFRHLPVVVEGQLAGIVSIGDLVKARIDLLESEREQLQSYIAAG
ncbi:CBS domain-containing protein [Pseudonocardia alaniniphila]|uniref:CBS domain-containing protein n=1 Tax=Pseudonocardia alaniniphila TaxID=75291 RepID=A0ABS9TDK3_9PSEU|nr:CBS domain-containing protein [Pseudonocardia alaniniphila]MCH6166604.1 CBS domain-containing protein [Pseudonocardia alaniniphila]